MRTFVMLVVLVGAMVGLAMAAGTDPAQTAGGGPGVQEVGAAGAAGGPGGSALFFTAVAVASIVALAVAAAGCGIAQGNAVARAVESIARQPESASRILTVSMIGLAFIESLTIYVLVVALILIYANPFVQYFIK
jgi:F-type H+-transporting ATPase subunit c